MKRYITYIICAITLLNVTACYQEIDLDNYKNGTDSNLLTITSIINTDSTISVAATLPYFYSDIHYERTYVENLNISIEIDGNIQDEMSYNPSSHLYESDIKPKAGDIVTIQTYYNENLVTCSDTVPQQIRIESVDAKREGPMHIYMNNDFLVTYYITFTDPAEEENYYFLSYSDLPGPGEFAFGVRDYTYEYVFQQLAQDIKNVLADWEPYSHTGLPFSDKGINGTTHTLEVKEILQEQILDIFDYSREDDMNRQFKLFSISKSYYEYLVSALCNNATDDSLHAGLIDLGMTEPLKYYSNINGGVGIFAAYNLHEVTMDILPIIGKFP